MAIILSESGHASTAACPEDELGIWLRSMELKSGTSSSEDLGKLLSDGISMFKDNPRYQNDPRFLKLWIVYLDTLKDFESITREMEESKVCSGNSFFYELYALYLESKGLLHEASMVYKIGIARNGEPLSRLKKAQASFLSRMSSIINGASTREIDNDKYRTSATDKINPWSSSTLKDLLEKLNPQFMKYDGYISSTKPYSGKVSLSSLRNNSRNKIIEIGGKKYQIKGCAGQGGFAQVYKAYINSSPDDVVALKVQKPAFPFEFHMYRILDLRIAEPERSAFGFAHKMHVFHDCSILICDYLSHGTLQDAVNSYLVMGKFMEEVLCIYFTIEMLRMLETLHSAHIIHGDFKADNLLIRYASDNLSEEDFLGRGGPWSSQGLCLVDWGRGIDLKLFPDNVEFTGDCRTSGFRCVEMQENRPWIYQVDMYGLCVIVHMMLHGSYMEIVKKNSPDGCFYQPKSSFKRYWKIDLWENLFSKMLNTGHANYHPNLLKDIRKSFEDYLCSEPQLIRKLKDLLVKLRTSLC
ncbi:hypothetical protein SAY87_011674 [Trapa incisa]|uniref:Mitotic checkpoint serine/threonine-protein kinase BUB1 n=1 Tax=Trapa incisa TaxID=236973 RepID=A0AAN7GZQ3_9MYRT|nr:hypothetical protein SAY87_011674 [Trapa incisa]